MNGQLHQAEMSTTLNKQDATLVAKTSRDLMDPIDGNTEVTTQQAKNVLNVSRSYLIQLLENGYNFDYLTHCFLMPVTISGEKNIIGSVYF